jgi:hypothetical protein
MQSRNVSQEEAGEAGSGRALAPTELSASPVLHMHGVVVAATPAPAGLSALLDRYEEAVWHALAQRAVWRADGAPLSGDLFDLHMDAQAERYEARAAVLQFADRMTLGLSLDAGKLLGFLRGVEGALQESARVIEPRVDWDPPGNDEAHLHRAIMGVDPAPPIPACDATEGLLRRVRQAITSVEIAASLRGAS